jgi:hypothetical protein
VLSLATSGHGVESVEALAGTGKTYMAGVLAQVFAAAGFAVIAAAPTARAARELREGAGIRSASTLARLELHLARCGGFPRPAVLIVDEAGMASTRESAEIVCGAVAAGVKVIAIGDSGQLASAEAGGWLGSLHRRFGAHELTHVMRQRDPEERQLLAQVHARRPARYLRRKRERGELEVFNNAAGSEDAIVAEWHRRQAELPHGQAVMIARDNTTRERLNEAARQLLRRDGALLHGATIGEREFAIGDRIIVRRNDRYHDVDNGMRGTVVAIDPTDATVRVATDASGVRDLEARYVAEHVEHAYALTGHGMQGGTVEWAGVIGAPAEFTANWSYTALSRSRAPTLIYLLREDARFAAERLEIGPPDQHARTPIQRMAAAMRRRDDEDLALDWIEPPEPPITPSRSKTRDAGRSPVADERSARIASRLERPGSHLIRALGPRPEDKARLRIWERAAAIVETYRFEHDVRGPSPIGDRPSDSRAAVAHRRAQREIELANRRLGRELLPSHAREL